MENGTRREIEGKVLLVFETDLACYTKIKSIL
jgi:hypothetical protein